MGQFGAEVLQLIDAIPPNGDLAEFDTDINCPLAAASGETITNYFEAVAVNPAVAQALHDGKTEISAEASEALAKRANSDDPKRMAQYASCMLRRASGQCPYYNPEAHSEGKDAELAVMFLAGEEI